MHVDHRPHSERRFWPTRGAAAALLVLALLLSACAAPQSTPGTPSAGGAPGGGFKPSEFQPPLPAPDFTLQDTAGQPFRLAEQKGRFVLLFFGYTSCPDVCPTTLSHLRQALQSLGSDADRVRVAMVTVDPERDTPKHMGAYLKHRIGDDPRFIGLTGPRKDLERVWTDYGVFVQREEARDSAAGYLVSHSAATYLIDPAGRLLATYPFDSTGQDIATDLRRRF